MKNPSERDVLAALLARVRRRMLFQLGLAWFVRAGVVILPITALLVAADQRWNQGQASWVLGGIVLVVLPALSAALASLGLGKPLHSALTLDAFAGLKDRVSSAWEFLEEPDWTEAHRAQVHDAIRRSESLDFRKVLRMEWPRRAYAFPLVAALLALSFLVPPLTPATSASIVKDPVRAAQLEHIAELRKEFALKPDPPEEVREILKKLEAIEQQFEQGEIGEREVMLELGRLEENLKNKLAEAGIENLQSELNTLVPHLSANAATLQIAQSIQDRKLDQAASEFQELADRIDEDDLPKEELQKMAAQFGAAAAKLGKKGDSSSFQGDLMEASESLAMSDSEGFQNAARKISDKLGLLSKCEGMGALCNSLGLCKAGLGQSASETPGYTEGPQTEGNRRGGLKAGTASSGNPDADPSRLADSTKKMLQIAGIAGKGPTETETEISEGQLSESKLTAREVHASYAALAEEAIEREAVPLSKRYHVKRYFQSIRPQGEE